MPVIIFFSVPPFSPAAGSISLKLAGMACPPHNYVHSLCPRDPDELESLLPFLSPKSSDTQL